MTHFQPEIMVLWGYGGVPRDLLRPASPGANVVLPTATILGASPQRGATRFDCADCGPAPRSLTA